MKHTNRFDLDPANPVRAFFRGSCCDLQIGQWITINEYRFSFIEQSFEINGLQASGNSSIYETEWGTRLYELPWCRQRFSALIDKKASAGKDTLFTLSKITR